MVLQVYIHLIVVAIVVGRRGIDIRLDRRVRAVILDYAIQSDRQ